MPDAISNTSPLLYLHRAKSIDLLPHLFDEIWVPSAVILELNEGRARGYDVPKPVELPWVRNVDPAATPSEWLSLDLGAGELAAMALGLENPTRVLLLDDLLARRTAQAAGLIVWGTLRIVLEAKSSGLIEQVRPVLSRLCDSGMWISDELQQRIMRLAGEV
ncbi:MAG: DUF3368 domain-containing protein [Candidatus Hydrogenedentes bacterium]|nr:DUF3368 domain-containing protein [Candidatus Hydrogenedentota bacterium]